MNNQNLIQIVAKSRKASFDSAEKFKEQRENFLGWLLPWNHNLKTWEMYENFEAPEGVIKSKPQTPQYIQEVFLHNTRNKLDTETICEIDRLEFEKAIEFICSICLNLMNRNIHFSVFYAKGQRSPHIRIYDLEELKDLNPLQHEKAQAKFWRSIAPWSFQHLDQSIWMKDHPVQLEFTAHWKYKTPFNLLFEWLPEQKNILETKKEYSLKKSKGEIQEENIFEGIKEKYPSIPLWYYHRKKIGKNWKEGNTMWESFFQEYPSLWRIKKHKNSLNKGEKERIAKLEEENQKKIIESNPSWRYWNYDVFINLWDWKKGKIPSEKEKEQIGELEKGYQKIKTLMKSKKKNKEQIENEIKKLENRKCRV